MELKIRVTEEGAGLSSKYQLLPSLEKCGIQPKGSLSKGEDRLILFTRVALAGELQFAV